MTKEEIKKNSDIITIIPLIVDYFAYALSNSGGLYSFVNKFSVACDDKSSNILHVSIPLDRVLNIDKIAKSIKMELERRELKGRIYS